jgi:hypothetical protein
VAADIPSNSVQAMSFCGEVSIPALTISQWFVTVLRRSHTVEACWHLFQRDQNGMRFMIACSR